MYVTSPEYSLQGRPKKLTIPSPNSPSSTSTKSRSINPILPGDLLSTSQAPHSIIFTNQDSSHHTDSLCDPISDLTLRPPTHLHLHAQTLKMSSPQKLPIHTQHCRFCNHLLLATTRTLSTLPRRSSPAADNALILPLEKLRSTTSADEDQEPAPDAKSNSSPKHVTIILSTTLPDRRATLIRREDGIEKRILLRCGRCRVVVGYYLDRVHWGESQTQKKKAIGEGEEDGEGEEEEEEERPPAMYVLPGSLVETEAMGGEGVGEKEWRVWGGDA